MITFVWKAKVQIKGVAMYENKTLSRVFVWMGMYLKKGSRADISKSANVFGYM